jgi:hypothetical protein
MQGEGDSFTSRKVYPLQGVLGTHWKGSCVGLSQSEHYGTLLPLPRNNPSFLRHPASKPSHYTDWASVNRKGFYCTMGADASANMVQYHTVSPPPNNTGHIFGYYSFIYINYRKLHSCPTKHMLLSYNNTILCAWMWEKNSESFLELSIKKQHAFNPLVMQIGFYLIHHKLMWKVCFQLSLKQMFALHSNS